MNETKANDQIAEYLGFDCDPAEAREWKSRGQWCIKPNDTITNLVSKNMSK